MRQQILAPNGRTHSPGMRVIPTYHPQEWGDPNIPPPGMREITTYHSLYPPVGDDAAKRTSGKSWKLLLWWMMGGISRWHHTLYHDDITHYITMTSHTISRWHHTLLNSHASWQLQCSRKCWFSICGLDALPIIIVYVCHATYTCTYRHCDNGYAPTNRMK